MGLLLRILVAGVVLTVLAWRDLMGREVPAEYEESGGAPVGDDRAPAGPGAEASQSEAAPRAPGGDVSRWRVFYVTSFWGFFLVTPFVGIPAVALVVVASGVLHLLATYRLARLTGFDGPAAVGLCLLVLAPFLPLLQYIAFGRNCRERFGPLAA